MDIEFIIQDTFALTRSNWKLAATFEEAWQAFAELTKGHYKTQEVDKNVDLEAQEDDLSSEEDGEDDDLPVPDIDDARSSSDEMDLEVRECFANYYQNANQSVSQRLMVTSSLALISTRISLLPGSWRNEIPKQRLSLIESWQR